MRFFPFDIFKAAQHHVALKLTLKKVKLSPLIAPFKKNISIVCM